MWYYSIFFIVIALSELLIDPLLRKKLNIRKDGVFTIYKRHTSMQKWIESALLIAFLIAIFQTDDPFPLVFSFLIILYVLRGFMAWKHQKAEKEYILFYFQSIVMMLTAIILVVVV